MDVTPSPKMFEAMKQLVDAACGPEPSKLEISSAANMQRIKRTTMFEALHRMVAVSMREGVNRAVREAHERLHGPRDAADRSAIDQAKDDAESGVPHVHLPN